MVVKYYTDVGEILRCDDTLPSRSGSLLVTRTKAVLRAELYDRP